LATGLHPAKQSGEVGRQRWSLKLDLSLVVPMHNEEQACSAFFERVLPILDKLDLTAEIICVDDGSRDGTCAALSAWRKRDARIRIVSLSRNFGKEAALTAGIEMAAGDAVVPMDADLQDPPELLGEMVARWRAGARVVLALRGDRSSDTALKRFTSRMFYRIFAKLARPEIPQNVGDFRLMDRRVVDALKRLPERSRFMKGMFAWVGFRHETVSYVRPERTSGTTKFNYWKLWNFALDGIFSFSAAPLKVWSYFGFALSLIAGAYLVVIIGRTIILGVDAPGYASLMSVILFFNGVILLSLGAIGEYLARVFVEVKGRPIYLVEYTEGFDSPPGRAQTGAPVRSVAGSHNASGLA
jgi:polyisoprenyl-phosphate glycosyltransferase